MSAKPHPPRSLPPWSRPASRPPLPRTTARSLADGCCAPPRTPHPCYLATPGDAPLAAALLALCSLRAANDNCLGRQAMVRTLEQQTMRKVYLRLLPFAILTYFFCYLDRINVGFAALTMNKDIGLDAAIYGMGDGAFFWCYVLFEVPSNIILEKVGARLWIARIMITWGLISATTAFCTGPYSFMAVRFLLGLAEAGLFPGFVLYFTYWFPDSYRPRINSGFTLALPIAVASGAPISTAILGLDGMWGLKGWQLMYIL